MWIKQKSKLNLFNIKAIESLQKIWTKPLNSYGLILASKWWSTGGQKALGFHQKDLHLCSEDEWKSWGFGTTWGWVNDDRIFIFGWTNSLMNLSWFSNVNRIYFDLNEINSFKCFHMKHIFPQSCLHGTVLWTICIWAVIWARSDLNQISSYIY